jgi:hypothetical protein
MKAASSSAAWFIILMAWPSCAIAYDFDTHRALSAAAFELSSTASQLRAAYGIRGGGVEIQFVD